MKQFATLVKNINKFLVFENSCFSSSACLLSPNVDERVSIITKLMKKFSIITFAGTFAEQVENFFYLFTEKNVRLHLGSLFFSLRERKVSIFLLCSCEWSFLVNELRRWGSYAFFMQGTISRFLLCSRYSFIAQWAEGNLKFLITFFLYSRWKLLREEKAKNRWLKGGWTGGWTRSKRKNAESSSFPWHKLSIARLEQSSNEAGNIFAFLVHFINARFLPWTKVFPAC